MESAIGLRRPDEGSVRVIGLDPQLEGARVRQRIGVQLQEAALPERMKVWEALRSLCLLLQAGSRLGTPN